MTRSFPLLATAVATLAACAAAPASGDLAGGGKADGEQVTLTFAADWSETADGSLIAGNAIRIAYDLERLTACRATDMGSDVWGVTGFASFDGGPAKSFAVSRLEGGHAVSVEGELDLPSGAHRVAMWFQISNKWGCVAYDSNTSANYAFDVEQRAGHPVVAFEADGTDSQSAAIHGGDPLVVHYDPARLAQCAGSTGGHAAWGITGYYQVDGGATHSVFVSRSEGSDLVAADPVIMVPHGRDLALWFEVSNVWGCHGYDSALGANYHFTIE